jgi:hypothetical protein
MLPRPNRSRQPLADVRQLIRHLPRETREKDTCRNEAARWGRGRWCVTPRRGQIVQA